MAESGSQGPWDGMRGRARVATLRTLADVWVPGLRPPPGADEPLAAFWRRSASELGVEHAVARYIQERLGVQDRDGLVRLLDLLTVLAPRVGPPAVRERVLAGIRRLHPDVAAGLDALRALTLLHFYAQPGPDGRNPNWPALGYAGPPQATPPAGDRLPTVTPAAGAERLELEADACVIGSGAGGGVIAATLAQAGLAVVVIEAGAHREEPDFRPYELEAYRDLYWRGGYQATEDRTVSLIAGATLGGGTVVNWMNCVAPPDFVREQWAGLGLAGLDGADFDRHLDAVRARISANTDCSDFNGPNARLAEGAKALGWSWTVAARNADPATYDPETAGHMGFGDRSGSKQSTLRTYLRDAVAAGARVVPSARAARVLVRDGRAAGVEGSVARPDGGTAELRVRASLVVAACGALETPALLLRSGVGGPAVGRHLRLHPVDALAGLYGEEQRAWWGAPQTVIVDEHRDLADGHGFLLEAPHFGTGLSAASVPWTGGRAHKELVARSARMATFIGVVRDRGEGRVTVDDGGEAVVAYPLDDALDRAHLRRALEEMARLHEAAGAAEILDLSPGLPRWRRGDGDLEVWLSRVGDLPMGA
ncbi:MAG TPA: NAD(P)-dependent oxidoreductase, partial [Egibacteraceae bacterium]|nr:NAD(P)-dependent oxidoreductase [Egibacteraceae bacterium]